jgi:hypothetical protein
MRFPQLNVTAISGAAFPPLDCGKRPTPVHLLTRSLLPPSLIITQFFSVEKKKITVKAILLFPPIKKTGQIQSGPAKIDRIPFV